MKIRYLFVLIFSLFGLNSLIAISHANQLSEINQKIEKQKSKINESRQKRNALQATLKQQEVEMGQVFTKLKIPRVHWRIFVLQLNVLNKRSNG